MSANVLYKTRCYLIGGMENENGVPWREKVKQELSSLNIIFFDPYHKPLLNEIREDDEVRLQRKDWMNHQKYDDVQSVMRNVRADDLRLCDLSDFFIMRINPKIASWESAEELTTINRMKKPIFLYIEGGKELTPIWIMGMIPHKYIYSNLEEIVSMIRKIDSGEKEIDNSRWRLLKKEYR